MVLNKPKNTYQQTAKIKCYNKLDNQLIKTKVFGEDHHFDRGTIKLVIPTEVRAEKPPHEPPYFIKTHHGTP